MTVEAAITNRLENYAGLTALVSDRIYPHRLPQSPTYPAVTYFVVSAFPRSRAMGADAGIVTKRIQIDVWGDRYGPVVAAAEQVRQALQRWSGTAASTTVHDIYLENQVEMYENDLGVYHHALDFEVVYGE